MKLPPHSLPFTSRAHDSHSFTPLSIKAPPLHNPPPSLPPPFPFHKNQSHPPNRPRRNLHIPIRQAIPAREPDFPSLPDPDGGEGEDDEDRDEDDGEGVGLLHFFLGEFLLGGVSGWVVRDGRGGGREERRGEGGGEGKGRGEGRTELKRVRMVVLGLALL